MFEGVARKNTVECDGEKVNIFSLPFIRPSFVRKVYPEESAKITDYTTAVRVVLEHSEINADETNILIAHQFVTGSETSGSESSLGTLDNVEQKYCCCRIGKQNDAHGLGAAGSRARL